MNSTVFELLKVILPPVFTGFITFLVARYTSSRNKPLDKLEISYNRVYFPIYRLFIENKPMDEIKEKSENYIKKYIKYVNRTTLIAFKYLVEAKGKEEQRAFANFKNNVKKINSKLRKKLGYLESDIFDTYIYSSPFVKNLYRLSGEIIIVYLFFVLVMLAESFYKEISIYFGVGLVLVGMLLCIELIELAVRSIISGIREKTSKKQSK